MSVPDSSLARLELPPSDFQIEPALAFVRSFAAGAGMESDRIARLTDATSAAMAMILEHNRDLERPEHVGLDVFESDGQLVVDVLNRGLPVFWSEHDSFFQAAMRKLDVVHVDNLGRDGQRIVLGVQLGARAERRPFAPAPVPHVPLDLSLDALTYRRMQPDEAHALSELVYRVYGYEYIHDYVYYPEKVSALLEEKKLFSFVASLPDGRLVGHVGLRARNDVPPVYEPCLGLVDPALKLHGIFGRLFHLVMEKLHALPMSYCIVDFVTNLDYTQKALVPYHPAELALFVGCQTSKTQARLEALGIGEDPKATDRYTLLLAVLPGVDHPFGREITLPANLGEMLGFLLDPLRIDWNPTSRFDYLPAGGEYRTRLDPPQSAVIFDMERPGRGALEAVRAEWHGLLRHGYRYGAVEVPVDEPGLEHVHDFLSEHGFFIAGFVPYHDSARLGMRFQALGPGLVDFSEIKVVTPGAKRLLDVVRASYERSPHL